MPMTLEVSAHQDKRLLPIKTIAVSNSSPSGAGSDARGNE
jgi:hypothetical protein